MIEKKRKKRDLNGLKWLGCLVLALATVVGTIFLINGKLAEDDRRNHEMVGAYIESNLIKSDEKLLSYDYDKEDFSPFGYELYVAFRILSDGKVSTHSMKVEMGSFEDFAEEFKEKEKLRKLEKEFDK